MTLDITIQNNQENSIELSQSASYSIEVSEKSPISVEVSPSQNIINITPASNYQVEITTSTQNTLEIISSSIVNVPAPNTSISPQFSYNAETLSRIDYADSSYKLFFYDINNLIRIDFHKNNVIYRKDFIYVADNLSQIIESTI